MVSGPMAMRAPRTRTKRTYAAPVGAASTAGSAVSAWASRGSTAVAVAAGRAVAVWVVDGSRVASVSVSGAAVTGGATRAGPRSIPETASVSGCEQEVPAQPPPDEEQQELAGPGAGRAADHVRHGRHEVRPAPGDHRGGQQAR